MILHLSSIWKPCTPPGLKSLESKGMVFSWRYSENHLICSLSAPTTGWLAVGFNEEESLSGTFLIMCRVQDCRPEAIEYSILKPGEYLPVQQLGVSQGIQLITGTESKKNSVVEFSLPIHPKHRFGKKLEPDASYHLLLAYSLEDDFTHHSIMRTSIFITL